MNSRDPRIWVNGDYIPESRPVLSGTIRGLNYGAGCFETLRVDQGQTANLEEHIRRLHSGLSWLGVGSDHHPSPDMVREVINELLESNRLTDRTAVIRIQASLSGGRGYGSGEEGPPMLIITAAPYTVQSKEYRLKRVQTSVVPAECRPADLKLSNTLHFLKAWREAESAGADDALMVTIDGHLAETAVANLFWKSGDRIFTPSRACDILPGIVRNQVIGLIERHSDYTIEEGEWTPDALEQADLVWVTNSLKRIQPVTAVDERRYPADHPLYHYLDQALVQTYTGSGSSNDQGNTKQNRA